MYSFSYLEPVCCAMSRSNCCFLTCIQVSQEAGQVVWYSHLFQNVPQFRGAQIILLISCLKNISYHAVLRKIYPLAPLNIRNEFSCLFCFPLSLPEIQQYCLQGLCESSRWEDSFQTMKASFIHSGTPFLFTTVLLHQIKEDRQTLWTLGLHFVIHQNSPHGLGL